MNRQQLAVKIWESANQMRSKIDPNEYKDYILGFIFYKYLSDKLVAYAKKNDFTETEIRDLSEKDKENVEHFKSNLGYFIAYPHLFSTWIDQKSDFNVSHVRDALNAFNRFIHPNYKRLFEGIFKTLETGLSKLGDTTARQTKAISDLIHLIKVIPMDGRQGYDVLGFIYEYLIGMFAANAGKKAGEFYTPHEVSLLMSEIIAHHLKSKKTIQIYDSASGSGSLLLNIGKCISKYMVDKDNIKYYAQELKQNTYNLTRMNLVMRGTLPSNIITRNADTLEDDWPYFDDQDPVKTYSPLYVDAVVSNPPYSQKWDPEHKSSDPRYARFGLAPKSKADYAFLLHDLYHLKPDGVMAIVLPHGVLGRGGEERKIRKQLIENGHLEAIIGLPPKIFFGTGIPTVILVLRQKRKSSDVLIVDASKGFAKESKNNKLRASDIKKIADTVIARDTVSRYSHLVPKSKIQENDYNLNIPRYVDSSEPAESWDLYASMFGGIPQSELDELSEFWKAFSKLRSALFAADSTPYVKPQVGDLATATCEHFSVKKFKKNFATALAGFNPWLCRALIVKMLKLHIPKQEEAISRELFSRLKSLPLIDRYHAYQILDNHWQPIAVDLEILQTEGFDAARVVEPNLVTKKKDGKDVEVQEGWKGRILPFDLVQRTHHKEELEALNKIESRLSEIATELDEIIESLSEADGEYSVLNAANEKFSLTEARNELDEQLSGVEMKEIRILQNYLGLLDTKGSKANKLAFVEAHPEVAWNQIEANKDGSYGKAKVEKYIFLLQSAYNFPEDSFASKLQKAIKLLDEEKVLKGQFNEDSDALHLQTRTTIENLSDVEVHDLLERKWIIPFSAALHELPGQKVDCLISKLEALVEKYRITYADNAREIRQTEIKLVGMIGELEANEFDRKGFVKLKSLLMGK